MTIKNRIEKLEAQQAQPATDPEEIKRRAQRVAALYSDPQWAAAVRANAAQWPSADNLRLLRIVELLDIAEARRAIA